MFNPRTQRETTRNWSKMVRPTVPTSSQFVLPTFWTRKLHHSIDTSKEAIRLPWCFGEIFPGPKSWILAQLYWQWIRINFSNGCPFCVGLPKRAWFLAEASQEYCYKGSANFCKLNHCRCVFTNIQRITFWWWAIRTILLRIAYDGHSALSLL